MTEAKIPCTPLTSRGQRDQNHVVSIVLRMGTSYVEHLDRLCEVNGRSRRELIEILIAEASLDYQLDPEVRITPL